MVQIIKKISLEVCEPNLFKAIVAKQYDSKSRYLKVTLVDDNKKIEVPETAEVVINATRSDGEKKSFAGVCNSDGTVTVPLTAWMLELGGVVISDVSVIDAEGRKLTSSTFIIEVESAACDNGDISEDENYDILVKLIEDVKNAKGLTAYELALKHGYEGTEEEWLESLNGVDGKDYILTEEDKSALVTDVLNALPVWNGGAY